MKNIYLLPFLAAPILVACGDDRIDISSAAPERAYSTEDEVVDYVRSYLPTFDGVPDSTLIDTINVTCGAMDLGQTPRELAQIVAEAASGLSNQEASEFGEFIGAGTGIVCPEHTNTVIDAGQILLNMGY